MVDVHFRKSFSAQLRHIPSIINSGSSLAKHSASHSFWRFQVRSRCVTRSTVVRILYPFVVNLLRPKASVAGPSGLSSRMTCAEYHRFNLVREVSSNILRLSEFFFRASAVASPYLYALSAVYSSFCFAPLRSLLGSCVLLLRSRRI